MRAGPLPRPGTSRVSTTADADATNRRGPVRRVADKKRPPGTERRGDVAAHHKQHDREDLGLQVRQASAGTDQINAPLRRPIMIDSPR